MCAPIDVNANKQLYCLMFLMNFLEVVLPLKDAKDANGSCQGSKGGMETFPLLQHLLYVIHTEPRFFHRTRKQHCNDYNVSLADHDKISSGVRLAQLNT
jgi:hypothetical protein